MPQRREDDDEDDYNPRVVPTWAIAFLASAACFVVFVLAVLWGRWVR